MSLIATISPWFVRLNIAEACVWFAIALGLLAVMLLFSGIG